jgi:hypothetical protein
MRLMKSLRDWHRRATESRRRADPTTTSETGAVELIHSTGEICLESSAEAPARVSCLVTGAGYSFREFKLTRRAGRCASAQRSTELNLKIGAATARTS